MGRGPRLGVGPPWTCRGEQLRWPRPRHGVREANVGCLVRHRGCVIVRRDDGRGPAVKGNNGARWSSDDMVLRLGRRQNEDVVEWWEEWPRSG
jgi:hypothetical protein